MERMKILLMKAVCRQNMMRLGDFNYFFENVKSVFEEDDLTIVNFEGTLTDSTTREDKQFAFKADKSYAEILTDGFVEAANPCK